MSDELHDLLDAALRGATIAAGVARAVQREESLSSISKAGNEPVTVADFAAQALILREIAARRPRAAIVAEETSEHLVMRSSEALLDRVRALVAGAIREPVSKEQLCAWIDHQGDPGAEYSITIDPIDGTKGFLRREQYAIAVGILRGKEPVGGILVCPNLECAGDRAKRGAVFTARRGEGAFERALDGGTESNARRIRVSEQSAAAGVRVLASVESSHGDPELVDEVIRSLGFGGGKVRCDSQVKYGLLARGDGEVYLRPRSKPTWRDHVWDHAAGVVIASEAGARVSDQLGAELDFSRGRRLEGNCGVLATHGPFHDSIVSTIRHWPT